MSQLAIIFTKIQLAIMIFGIIASTFIEIFIPFPNPSEVCSYLPHLPEPAKTIPMIMYGN